MFKEARMTNWMTLIFTLSLLASCGSGGGGSSSGSGSSADFLTLTKSGINQTRTYTEDGVTTSVSGRIVTGASYPTNITLCFESSWTGCTTYLSINIKGTTSAAYAIGSFFSYPQAYMYYSEGTTTYESTNTGTVTLTRIDAAAGGIIEGTFTGITVYNVGPGSIPISGSFRVTIDTVIP